MHYLNLAQEIGSLTSSIAVTVSVLVGLIPKLRHRVVKSITESYEDGKYAARMKRTPSSRYDHD